MKKTAIIPLILGLGIGLFAVKLAVDTIRKAQAASATARVIKVVQAAQDIESQTEVTPEMVKLIETTDTSLAPPHERMEKLEDVVGRVTAKAIPANVPVLASMLAPPGTPAGLQGRIRPGYRAVSIRIDEASAVAYQIKAGDWVDVIVVMDVDAGMRTKETIARVILEHVEVAAIGHDSTAPATAPTGRAPKPAKSATLLVKEEDVPKLHLAATRGKLTLAMRGEDDLPTTNVSGEARYGQLMAGLNSVPVLPPPSARPSDGDKPFWMNIASSFMGSGSENSKKQKSSKKEDKAVAVDAEYIPVTVMVVRNAGNKDGGRNIERVTFAGEDSGMILEMRPGAPRSAPGSMMDGNRASMKRSEESDQ